MFAKVQQCLVAGDNGAGTTRDGTFEYAVVRFVGNNPQSLSRLNHRPEFSQKHRDVGEFFAVAREFATQYTEQFIDDGLRNNQPVTFFDDALQRGLAPPPGEHQRRDQNVGVENDLQSRR